MYCISSLNGFGTDEWGLNSYNLVCLDRQGKTTEGNACVPTVLYGVKSPHRTICAVGVAYALGVGGMRWRRAKPEVACKKKKHCKYFVTDRWRIKPKPTHSNPFKVFVPKPKSQLFSAVLHLMEYSYNSKTEATLSYLFTEQTKQTFSIHILAFWATWDHLRKSGRFISKRKTMVKVEEQSHVFFRVGKNKVEKNAKSI